MHGLLADMHYIILLSQIIWIINKIDYKFFIETYPSPYLCPVNKQKMLWVSRYISRPLIVIVSLLFILYKFFPNAYTAVGIDIKDLAEYSFYFFLIKGIVWLVIIFYGYLYLKNKKQESKKE